MSVLGSVVYGRNCFFYFQSVEEWEKRAVKYHEHCQAVLDLFLRLSQAPNQQLVQEIYPYIWDVKEVVMLLNAFVKWLGNSAMLSLMIVSLCNQKNVQCRDWYSKGSLCL